MANRTFFGAHGWLSAWGIVLTLLAGLSFSALIPPLQSPDEFDHIKRAYLLRTGKIVLDAPAGSSSGGLIDTGLSAFFDAYAAVPRKPDRKLSADETASARSIRWTGERVFSPAPGTGYYFPLIYLPQAIGLAAGEGLGLTVDESYHLARFMAMLTVALLLFTSFCICSPSPFVMALLVMPMSVFQFSSASLDGVSTALAVFVVASFLKLAELRHRSSPVLFYLLAAAVFLLATSRLHLLPLLGLLVAACFYLKGRTPCLVAGGVMLAVALWLFIGIGTTVDTRLVVGASTSSLAMFYVTHPWRFLEVLGATLSPDHLRFYRDSFVGVLGWLDARFSGHAYVYLSAGVALAGLLSVSFRGGPIHWSARPLLLASALACVLLVFFALLITWSPHPAAIILGVQGRYFLIPAIMIAYAVSGRARPGAGFPRQAGLAVVALISAFTMFAMPRVLIERYYLALEQPPQGGAVLRPSVALAGDSPITLFMRSEEGGKGGEQEPLGRIGILFGTYARINPGSAELRLATADGQTVSIPFELSGLADNQYTYFALDPKAYTSGQIVSGTGGGVSTWEAHRAGEAATCLVRQYHKGRTTTTPPCPRP